MAALSPVSNYESDALRAGKAVRAFLTAHHKALLTAAGVVVLLLLLAAVRDVLREVRYDEIVAAMKSTTAAQVALAALATLLSYVALTGYDWAALRYAGQTAQSHRRLVCADVGATVAFYRKGSTDRAQEHTPQGVVAEDGSFELTSPAGKGAAPGEYVVLVEWKVGAGKARGRSPGLSAPDRFKGRYLNPDNPQLHAEVKPTSNDLPPFELR